MPEDNIPMMDNIDEAYLKSAKDIYYNKDKFLSGEINVCFITGQSGSGKSTMSNAMSKGATNIENVELDEVVMNRAHRSIEQYKEMGNMVYAFFKGPGKSLYLDPNDKDTKIDFDKHNEDVTKAFVKFAIPYAKAHKNTRFIIEGTWLFRFVPAEQLKDCAVCIKGTSAATSLYRAGKRDGQVLSNLKTADRWFGREGALQKYRNYFEKLMKHGDTKHESVVWEAYFKSVKDIYYNKTKFLNGDTNVCIITGQSGSGKSTMATAMTKGTNSKIENIELDEVIMNKAKRTIEQYKEMGDMVYAFFQGPGKSLYIDPHDKGMRLNWDDQNKKMITAFINFALPYAKAHKSTKYIIEGTWIFRFIPAAKIKDCAVCIKGTSAATSLYRAGKRDNNMICGILSSPRWFGREGALQKYRDYFTKLMGKDSDEDKEPVKESTVVMNEHFNNIVNDIISRNGVLCYSENYNETTIDFRDMLAEAANAGSIKSKDDAKTFYEGYVLNTIPVINNAIEYAIEQDVFNGYKCFAEHKDDYSSGLYKIRFMLSESSEELLNNRPINEAVDIMHYANNLIALEAFASNSYLVETVNNPRSALARLEAMKNWFDSYKINEAADFEDNFLEYTAEQIIENRKNAMDNMYKLEEFCAEFYGKSPHSSKSTVLEAVDSGAATAIHPNNYTDLTPKDIAPYIPAYKAMYLQMVYAVEKGTKDKTAIYVPGWDKFEWPEPPAQFFDQKCTDVFTTMYGGRKYGQLSVVICEIDGGRARLPIIKAILDLCNRLVPDEFNMSKIEPNKLGFFPCVIATPGGYTTKIALNSNHFIWR